MLRIGRALGTTITSKLVVFYVIWPSQNILQLTFRALAFRRSLSRWAGDRWKSLLLMICYVRRLTLAINSVNNFKSHLLLPYRGSCCTTVSLETILFANSDLRWELRWISVELNCIESCRAVPVISDGSYAVMYWYSFRALVVIDKRLNSLACKYWPFLICHPRKDRLTYYFRSEVLLKIWKFLVSSLSNFEGSMSSY